MYRECITGKKQRFALYKRAEERETGNVIVLPSLEGGATGCVRYRKYPFMSFQDSIHSVNCHRDEKVEPKDADSDIHKVLRAAQEELRRLLQHKWEIAQRTKTIRVTLAGLVALFGSGILNEELSQILGLNQPNRRSGITDVCRVIVSQATKPMTTREVCEALRREHPQLLEDQRSPTATVATVLSRLAKGGKIRLVVLAGQTAWESVT